jgi:EmrB/QacA subfamily drug resistance transporter
MKAHTGEKKFHQQNWILFIVSFSSFITAFMGSSLNIALPTIASEFRLSSVQIGWIASSYLLSTVVFLLPFGRIGDMFGRKILFTTGATITVVSSAASILAPNGDILIAFRAFQGLGAAMLFASSIPVLTSAFPPQKRGRILGISVACVYLGLSMGPFLGGMLTQSFGWRSLFYFIIPGMLFVSIISVKIIPADKKSLPDSRFDKTGALLYGLAVLCSILGLSSIIKIRGAVLLACGIILFILFFNLELRRKHPLIPVRLFRHNRVFIFSNLAAMINYSATFAISFFMSLYLQHVCLYSPREAGLVLIVQPLFQALFSPFSGTLSDRVDPRILASSGMGLIACSLSVIALFPGILPIPLIMALLAVMGLGFALFSSPNNNAILGSVDHTHLGIASSVLSTMRTFGQVLSMAVAVLLLSHFVGSREIGEHTIAAFLTTFKYAFVLFSISCFLGIFASLSRGKRQ